MGGLALKNTFTRRYQKEEYFDLVKDVFQKIMSTQHTTSCAVIPAYDEKESFGDMDVLYSTYDDHIMLIDHIKEVFSPNEIVKNGEVISFDYKELQIDVIHAHQDYFEYALSYFSWNDTGNLIGKLAHQFGLKHGHKGLVLPLRDGDNKFHDVVITLDHDKTLKFLELDVEKFNSGFNNLEEMFKFVSDSPFYNPDNYKLENLNTIARVRDKKRETYRKFLEFGERYTGPRCVRLGDKSMYLEQIFEFFPEAYPEYVTAIKELAFKKYISERFNGNLVRDWTGLNGKALGEFMVHLKAQFIFRPENLVTVSETAIEAMVRKESNLYV